ncbi:hypothetical protein CYY_009016 [Polysphondylium violaceum]|uniref:FNIP repeat-containing protein n=1 Tax=Polysphondylium violaceum TaxID=133409 RepID=A0A8J4PMC5_9MYCE|nr:hypothetical protein CYY_009016 [Polysphondylium violaceum]
MISNILSYLFKENANINKNNHTINNPCDLNRNSSVISNSSSSSSSSKRYSGNSLKNELFFTIWKNQFLRFSVFLNFGNYDLQVIFQKVSDFEERVEQSCMFTKFKSIHLTICCDLKDIDNLITIYNKHKSTLKQRITFFQLNVYARATVVLCIPDFVDKVSFSNSYTGNIYANELPNSLKELEIGERYSGVITSLPDSIKKLSLGLSSQCLMTKNFFPQNLKVLKFNCSVSHPLKKGMFPDTIEYLYINFGYAKGENPLTSECLPKRLLYLNVLNYKYKFPSDCIPKSLEKFSIGPNYELEISDQLPSTLKSLKISVLDDDLKRFKCLETLSIGSIRKFSGFSPFSSCSLPSTITNLSIIGEFNCVIPSSVTQLEIGEFANIPSTIPKSVKKLKIGGPNHSFSSLPSGITHLTFNDSFNESLSHIKLPDTLLHLDLGCHFNYPIGKNDLPESLTSLTFSTRFNEPLTAGVIPSNVQTLKFGDLFNQPLVENLIPPSVCHLKFGYRFCQNLFDYLLPPRLTLLSLDSSYIRDFDLPKTLSHLQIYNRLWSFTPDSSLLSLQKLITN